jgi:hypothetical protein
VIRTGILQGPNSAYDHGSFGKDMVYRQARNAPQRGRKGQRQPSWPHPFDKDETAAGRDASGSSAPRRGIEVARQQRGPAKRTERVFQRSQLRWLPERPRPVKMQRGDVDGMSAKIDRCDGETTFIETVALAAARERALRQDCYTTRSTV